MAAGRAAMPSVIGTRYLIPNPMNLTWEPITLTLKTTRFLFNTGLDALALIILLAFVRE